MGLDLKFLKEIDFYGKSPEFYYKGSPKKTTIVGRIMTFIYIIIYIVFLAYKLNRMLLRVDISFFDVYSNENILPSMNVPNETFYILFAAFNTSTDEPIIDETIYYPVATFNSEVDKDGDQLIIAERCIMEDIATKYKKFYEEYGLENYYCLKDVNRTLIPYSNSFYVKIFPCKNTSENNYHCKTKEIIDDTLKGNYFSFEIADITLTPEDFENPVSFKSNYFYTFVYKNYGQYLYTQMESVYIETDYNMIGFDFFTNIKTDYFMKYSDLMVGIRPGYDLDDEENEESIVEFEVQLTDRILTEKRSYSKSIDILGEVGGFMEIISIIFGLVLSIIVDFLYDISVVNNLFSFDLKSKNILIKNNKDNFEKKIYTNKKVNNKYKELKDIFTSVKTNNIINNSFNIKPTDNRSDNLCLIINGKNNNINNREDIYSKTSSNKVKSVLINIKRNEIKNKNDKNSNVKDKIELNQFLIHLSFCCVRKKANINNILLNEGMNIVSEKLDIFNIFKIINRNEKTLKNLKNYEKIDMSVECIKNLKKIK